MTLTMKDDPLVFHEISSNYSLQHHDSFSSFDSTSPQHRKIQNGDQETRLKQLYSQVEQLSLSNARLTRVNRNLKLECDKIVEEKTFELKQALKMSVEHNIRLQRSNRLLKDEYLIQSVKCYITSLSSCLTTYKNRSNWIISKKIKFGK